MKTHSALAVANWFLARAEREGTFLDPMKVQKLVYFAHGWSLALTGIPLIEEHPEAWDYGPVVPSVYHEFKKFGRAAIKGRATSRYTHGSEKLEDITHSIFVEPKIDEDEDAEKLLGRVWDVYGPLTGVQLSNMTHVTSGAWYKTYHELANGVRGVGIPDDLIKLEFIEKAERGAREPQPA